MFVSLRLLAKFAADLSLLVRESTMQRSVDHQDEKLATRSRHTSALRLNVKSPRGIYRLWFTNIFTDILLKI